MFKTTDVSINNLIVHSVGNKLKGESLVLSGSAVAVGSELEAVLTKFMFSPFKSNELFNFNIPDSNAIYQAAAAIFGGGGVFAGESKKIARHLFEEANNPKMNGGNLFVTHFKDFIINDLTCDGIGIFKSEASDTFLKIKHAGDRVAIEREAGINTSKLAKGAIIFNTEAADGYVVAVLDKRPRTEEISYWCENFLDVSPRHDNYYQTKNAMACVEQFISQRLPNIYSDVDKSQQVDLLLRSLDYFKENDKFDWDQFAKDTFISAPVISELDLHKESYEHDYDIEIASRFEINTPAVKAQTKMFKSVIKLDDRFDIIIHKDKENLIRGKDKETGLNYYQLLFKEEE